MSEVINIFTNLDSFFKEKMTERIQFKIPALIVVLNALMGAISGYVVTKAILLSAAVGGGFAGVGAIFGAVGGFLGVLVLWPIYTAVFYGLSALFGGEGSFKRSLEFVGYGYIPMLVNSIFSLYAINQVSASLQASSANPAQMAQMLSNDPIMQVATLVGIIFQLWSANIWIFGLKNARNLNLRGALISVGLPVGLLILYSLISYIGGIA
ncbi:YIP1 family protein [Methanohalophilus sp.]